MPPEQSLVIETSAGIVVLVGCSHPGVVKLVRTAKSQRKKADVELLLGGFHMLQMQPDKIKATIAELQQEHVRQVVPAHCTGDLTKELFQVAYGEEFNTAGAGRRVALDKGKFVISTIEANRQTP